MQLLWHIFRWFCGGVVFCALQLLLTGNCHWTDLAVFSLLCIPLDAVNERMPWTFPLWLQAVLGGIVLIVSQLAAGLVFNVWLVWGFGITLLFSAIFGADLSQICAFMAAVGRPALDSV